MPHQEPAGSAEQPLQGVMLCFTSIGPEDRTRYADIAMQMGADHKLDLTSDTTHLIVGSTDTLKYQYVAREREDVKVLRPEWIEAVRDHWINARTLDLNALLDEHRVPTLSGLKICITGFEDLSFRAQLQNNVKANGGEYTGDLTKDVTHLIAAKPEGKKYEYGMQWQKKVVSLKWYKDSLDRGMQLDESLYHPTVSAADQGLGAWNRKPRPSPQLGKRAREDQVGPEPSRKLRRTASARLGSQSQGMWSDIVGGAGFDAQGDLRPPLKPSISMPALRRPDGQLDQPGSFRATRTTDADEGTPVDGKILAGCLFVVQCRDQKKDEHLKRVLHGLGASVVGEDETQTAVEADKQFVILPHDIAGDAALPEHYFPNDFHVVSELWLEKCMVAKSFIAPESYPLGQVVREPRTPLKGVVLNVSGFDAVETGHIIKIVTILGGTYAHAFTSAVSVLVCRASSANKGKIALADHLSIPVVNENWLLSTIKGQSKAIVMDYLLQPLQCHTATTGTSVQKKESAEQRSLKETLLPPKSAARPGHKPNKAHGDKKASAAHPGDTRECSNDVQIHQESTEGTKSSGAQVSEQLPVLARSETEQRSDVAAQRPLREIFPTSVRRNGKIAEPTRSQFLDGASSMEAAKSLEHAPVIADGTKPTDIAAINGAIRDMLDARSKLKAERSNASNDTKKKGRLVGRAMSNLSNSSSTSKIRHSRAGSINSINTDGVGSELPANLSGEHSSSEPTATTEKSSFSFTGRAKRTLDGINPVALTLDNPELARSVGLHAEQQAAPPMTQLGYEDPEEAVLLREKLAASRRRKSKEGVDHEGETQGAEQRPLSTKQKPVDRKIRDDDMLAGANMGWGAGRRTRHKQRSPRGMQDF